MQACAAELSQSYCSDWLYEEKSQQRGHQYLEPLLDMEAAHMARCFTTQDHKLAAQAFVAKEAPVFARGTVLLSYRGSVRPVGCDENDHLNVRFCEEKSGRRWSAGC